MCPVAGWVNFCVCIVNLRLVNTSSFETVKEVPLQELDTAMLGSMSHHRAYMKLLLEPKSFTPKSAFVGGLFVCVCFL